MKVRAGARHSPMSDRRPGRRNERSATGRVDSGSDARLQAHPKGPRDQDATRCGIYNLYHSKTQGRPGVVRQSGVPRVPTGCHDRPEREFVFPCSMLRTGGFVRRDLGSFVGWAGLRTLSLGSFVDSPGSFAAGCCIRCNIPGQLMHRPHHHDRLCCVGCNNPTGDVASDATTRARMLRPMQQPERFRGSTGVGRPAQPARSKAGISIGDGVAARCRPGLRRAKRAVEARPRRPPHRSRGRESGNTNRPCRFKRAGRSLE